MKILMALLEAFNGKKTTTGAVMLLAVLVLEQVGIPKNEATTIATNIMLTTGSVITAWGYIHKWIKAKKK